MGGFCSWLQLLQLPCHLVTPLDLPEEGGRFAGIQIRCVDSMVP